MRLSEVRNTIKCNNIGIIGLTEGEERKKDVENLFKEIIVENLLCLGKKAEIHIHEAQSLHKTNPRRSTPRYIVIKTAKSSDKEKILKSTREKKTVI